MAATPGRLGLPEPTFRTAEDAWVSFDTVLARLVKGLGGEVSPVVAAAVVQVARHELRATQKVDVARLAREVTEVLRHERVLITPGLVERILRVYARTVDDMDVVQVSEG